MAASKNIAVIGAGPMGLAVGYQAARDGHRVTIFEADDRVGGMTAAFDFDGLAIERYYHFICASDRPLFELLEELGIQDKLCWKETRMGYYYMGQVHPWGNPIALLRFPQLSLLSKIRYGAHAFFSTAILRTARYWARIASGRSGINRGTYGIGTVLTTASK